MPSDHQHDLTPAAQRGVDDALAIHEAVLKRIPESNVHRHDVASRLAAAVYARVVQIADVRGDPNDPTSGRAFD
jgi:hypothetical protein